MANTYVVTSASYIAGSSSDPQVTIVGTVNGAPVTVQVWLSAVEQANTAGGLTAVKNLIAPIMLAASQIVAPPPPTAPTQLPTGTFSQ
jgi:hypothetical protein